MRKVAFACTNAGPITENERKFHERVYRNNRDMEVGFSIMYKEGFNEVFFGTTRSSDALPACKGITVETSPIFSKYDSFGRRRRHRRPPYGQDSSSAGDEYHRFIGKSSDGCDTRDLVNASVSQVTRVIEL